MAPKKRDSQFREREELLDFLLEISQATAESLDLDKLLPMVADFVQRVIPHDIFAILLWSGSAQGLRIRYARGHRDEIVRNLVIPLGEGLTGISAATRQPVLVGDVRNDPRYLMTLDAVRSELAVPMVSRGKLVGVIDLQATRVDAFSENDLSLLRLIASRVVSSIDNARLYRRVVTQSRTSRMLAHLSQEFSSTLQIDELLTRIAKAMRTLIHYDAFSVLLVDQEQRALRHRFSQRYDERVMLDSIPLGRGITGAAVDKREAIRVDDILTDPRYISSHPGIRSEVAVPLVVKDRVIGVMNLESERIGHFTDEHVRTLSLLAPQIASSVENARLYEELAQREQRMEQDLKAGLRVQSILLPRQAEIEGLEIGVSWRPAREVSGDLYDFFEQGEDEGVIAFGDSSGKGAAAALYGALVSGLLRSLAPRIQRPSALMKRLNDILLERRIDAQYVTLLLMYWNRKTRSLTLSNAGGLTPIVCRGGQRIKVRAEGVPLGLLPDREYDETTFQTEPGDVILLLSDGVPDQTAAVASDGEYGMQRAFNMLTKVCEEPAQTITEAILADIDRHRGDVPLTDDQTLVAIRILPS